MNIFNMVLAKKSKKSQNTLSLPRRVINSLTPKPLRNRALLAAMLDAGLDMAQVRDALVTINGVCLSDLVRDQPISISTMSRTIKPTNNNGKDFKPNRLAKRLLCEALDLTEQELFPRNGSGQ